VCELAEEVPFREYAACCEHSVAARCCRVVAFDGFAGLVTPEEGAGEEADDARRQVAIGG
jgi:hypothetical protein